MKKFFCLYLFCLLLTSPVARCEAKSSTKVTAPTTNAFTPPPELMNEIPEYVDGAGRPVHPYDPSGADGSQPAFEELVRLPSLTPDQVKLVRRIQADSQLQAKALAKDIKTLQNELAARQKNTGVGRAEAKGSSLTSVQYQAPGDMQSMGDQQAMQSMDAEMQLPASDDLLKSKIQNSTDQINAANAKSWQAVLSLLSDQQKMELEEMRSGKLIISDSQKSPPLSSEDPAAAKRSTLINAGNKPFYAK
jgi:hypothetical protein